MLGRGQVSKIVGLLMSLIMGSIATGEGGGSTPVEKSFKNIAKAIQTGTTLGQVHLNLSRLNDPLIAEMWADDSISAVIGECGLSSRPTTRFRFVFVCPFAAECSSDLT